MRVFKFGGASVKDAAGVKNVVNVLKHEGLKNTLIVLSAMGKMTNAFEEIVAAYCYDKEAIPERIQFVYDFHMNIISELFDSNNKWITADVHAIFLQMDAFMVQEHSDYDFIYDQIVGYGELLATKILSAYLADQSIENQWLDVRTLIQTDEQYRDAKVNWEVTAGKIVALPTDKLYITQGFLGRSTDHKTTTLGREGSDFTAAIFAFCMDVESVTIWKDVDGVLNADPRYFDKTELLERISYGEAIEMAFYGASVIHPKTLKPLENKNIPLYVRSFYDLENKGTLVGKGHPLTPDIPCYILKRNQILVSVSARDFSFMVEHNIRDIFDKLHRDKLKVNLIQNSAISFSVCIEDKYNNFEQFIDALQDLYEVDYTKDVQLYTIRHASKKAVKSLEKTGEVLLKQSTRETVQIVMQ